MLPRADDEVSGPIISQVRRFAARAIDARAIDRDAAIPREVLSGLAELGLFGLTLPEAFGGSGCSLATACGVIAELARFDRSVAVTLGLHLGLGTRGLTAFGTRAQHERYLPGLASGACLAAFAATESGAGSDLSTLQTNASDVGAGLRVNGEKIYVTNGGLAGLYTIAVATPGLGGSARGQSLLLIERGDPGLQVAPEEHKLGLRGSSTTGLVFDSMLLPHERVLGEASGGARELGIILSWGRTLMSAGCCGAARAALEKVASHLSTRRQFGRPLAALEVVREQVALLTARVFAMEALVDEVSRESEKALLVRSLAAKVFSSEGAWAIVDGAIQLHGGLGFIEDTGLALLLRDVRVTRIFEGANDVLLAHLGASELLQTSPPPRAALSEATASAALASAAAALASASPEALASPSAAALASASPEALASAAAGAEALAQQVDALQKSLQARFRIGVFRQPRWLHRLGAACVWREAIDAALRRARASGRADEVAQVSLLTQAARAAVSTLSAEPPPRELYDLCLRESLPRPEGR